MTESLFGDRAPRKAAINQMTKRAKRGHAELPAGVEPQQRPFVSVRDID
jgi:hypothetical protein